MMKSSNQQRKRNNHNHHNHHNQKLTMLRNYMLTNKQIIKIVNNSFYNYSIKKELQPTKKKEVCPYFFPHYNDTLFWCFYIRRPGKATLL